MDRVQREEAVREAAVTLVLEARREYLAAGASPLSHWDHLHDRLLVAVRTSETMDQAVTAYRRGLRLGAPSSGSSAAMMGAVRAADADAREALDLIETEIGLVIAMARLESERRRDAREGG